MISLRTVVLGWWDKLMWWFLWYSTYNEQWNGRSIYQEEWITWYRFKSYETFHNYFASKTNEWIFRQNSFRWGSGGPKCFAKANVNANILGNSLYSFPNQFQGPWQILWTERGTHYSHDEIWPPSVHFSLIFEDFSPFIQFFDRIERFLQKMNPIFVKSRKNATKYAAESSEFFQTTKFSRFSILSCYIENP